MELLYIYKEIFFSLCYYYNDKIMKAIIGGHWNLPGSQAVLLQGMWV